MTPLFLDTGFLLALESDCISFVVMKRMKLKTALAFDQHFVQAGFERIP